MEPSKCNPLTFSTSALTFHSEKYAYIGIYDFIHCVRNDMGKGSKYIYITKGKTILLPTCINIYSCWFNSHIFI